MTLRRCAIHEAVSQANRQPVRAAVIGSGFGGLAAAIRLQTLGVQTVLYEARDLPGGRAYVYRERGFTFDAGPTVITAPNCLEELFALSGRALGDYVELIPVHPFYRLLWEDGTTFDYVGDLERMLAQIRAVNPADVDGYQRFVAYSRAVFDKGYTELAATPFLRFWDMVKVAPHLIRLRADRNVYDAVAKFIRDERLRQAFSFHSLLVGGNPFETSAIYTLIHCLERTWGVFFPRGGTGALVRGLVTLFEELGGQLRLNAPVRHIDRPGANKSRTDFQSVSSGVNKPSHTVWTDADAESFDLVVSNADLHHTYAKLYGDQRMARRLERMSWSMSLFVIYFGTDRRYPDVAHHTVLFGNRYRELLADIFHGEELADDFSLYLHAPTVTDPSLAPSGCEAFYVLSPVPHLGTAPIDWKTVGPAYADRILASLERRLPDLRKHIVVQRLFTPADFASELGAHLGSAFSVAPLLTQSAWFRPHNRCSRIPGLYLVGAGTHPGAGVPGVVNSAKATVGLIARDYRL